MLKSISKSAILALMLVSSISAYQSTEWVKIAPVGAGFSVMMPAKPEEEVHPGDDLTAHLFRVTTDNALYIVAYGDYAPSVNLKVDDELIANRDKFLQGLGAGLTSSKAISVERHHGLEFTAESDQAAFKSRIFIFGYRFHQITVAIFKGKEDTANANRFFASFEFTKPEARQKP